MNQYISFVEVTSRLIRNSRIPLYSSKFSKKTYSQHQLMILFLLKEYSSEEYRDIIELTDFMTEIKSKIDLDSVSRFHDSSQILSKN